MPCDTTYVSEEEKVAREALRKKRLAALEEDLLRGKVRIMVKDGKPTFDGWPVEERAGMCDACTIRRLTAEGSSALRMAMSRTQGQTTTGRISRETLR